MVYGDRIISPWIATSCYAGLLCGFSLLKIVPIQSFVFIIGTTTVLSLYNSHMISLKIILPNLNWYTNIAHLSFWLRLAYSFQCLADGHWMKLMMQRGRNKHWMKLRQLCIRKYWRLSYYSPILHIISTFIILANIPVIRNRPYRQSGFVWSIYFCAEWLAMIYHQLRL